MEHSNLKKKRLIDGRFHGIEDVHQYGDVIMSAMAFRITGISMVYSTVWSGADQRKHQSSASLSFVGWNSTTTGKFPAQRASNAENVPFNDVIIQMVIQLVIHEIYYLQNKQVRVVQI